MKHGGRKILKTEKFQVKMLLYLFISQLPIPDLISIPFHNNYVVTGVSVYIKNKFSRGCYQFNQKFLEWVYKCNISLITSKLIINMNVLCISQFQERTSPPAMQPLGFCTYFQPRSRGFVPSESPGDCPGVGPIIKVQYHIIKVLSKHQVVS